MDFEPRFQSVLQKLSHESNDSSFSDNLVAQFLDPIQAYTRGGKRVRPFLIAAGADTLSNDVINAGIAFELLHTFVLVHDDIMDGATLRRNAPTVHVAFENQGIPGKAGAMLVGDFLFASSNEFMSQHVALLMPLFSKMQRFLTVGQFYEMIHWGKRVERSVSENIAIFKSAQYTFEYPLHMGLTLANKDTKMLDIYAKYTGLAFQIRDDWLDIAHDIESGKDKNLDTKNSVANIVQLTLAENNDDINKTKEKIKSLLSEYRQKAEENLNNSPLSDRQKQSLQSLLTFSSTI